LCSLLPSAYFRSPCLSLFVLYCSAAHRYLHSFPTRRSSDLHDLARAHLCCEVPKGFRREDEGIEIELVQILRRVLLQLDVDALRSEEHTSELQSRRDLVCRLLLEKKKKKHEHNHVTYEYYIT